MVGSGIQPFALCLVQQIPERAQLPWTCLGSMGYQCIEMTHVLVSTVLDETRIPFPLSYMDLEGQEDLVT